MTNIAIVGGGLSWIRAPWDNPKWEVWAHASIHVGVKPREAALWFDVHAPTVRAEPKVWSDDYSAWLMREEGRTAPVMVQETSPQPPNSSILPRAAIHTWLQKHGGTKKEYVTSTGVWMLLYALYREASKAHPCTCKIGHPFGAVCPTSEQFIFRNLTLGLWGINYEEDTEYVVQRPCMEYWLGFARALGVKIFITPTSRLCRDRHVYGFDGHRADLLKGHAGKMTYGVTRISTAQITNGILHPAITPAIQAMIDEEREIFGMDTEQLWKEAASKF